MTKRIMTYTETGVDYGAMDPFKRAATRAAGKTNANANRLGYRVVKWSRGESCFLLESADHYLAHVEEGLGSKNVIADEIGWGYGRIGQDAVAMIVNDMITLGALPISLAMHLAVGNGKWFSDKRRVEDLIKGWRHGCDLAGAVWGGGETQTVRDIVYPEGSVISGSAIGIVDPKSRVIRPQIVQGDAIIFLTSTGVHANGVTLARDIAGKIKGGFDAQVGNMTYGAALLAATPIYVPVIQRCLDAHVPIHYAVHITGHGWRKLMRATEPFVYVIEKLPKVLPIFDFIMAHGPVTKREMYATYNMGAGFALYVPSTSVARVIKIAGDLGFKAMMVGYIEKRGREKKVIIEPEGIEFEGSTLGVR